MNDTLVFLILRTFIVAIGIIIAYYIVKYVIKPKILEPNCLVNSNTCVNVILWKSNNSFLAEIKPVELWMWFDGKYIYLYNQTTGNCDDTYEPSVVIQPIMLDGKINYQRQKDQCVSSLNDVKIFYTSEVKEDNRISLWFRYTGQPTSINIFESIVGNQFIDINKII